MFSDVFKFVVLLLFFFFFKQKTAYEMRISDWSSDVCSSDLLGAAVQGHAGAMNRVLKCLLANDLTCRSAVYCHDICLNPKVDRPAGPKPGQVPLPRVRSGDARRSEEHTSELQSLMRISYAVFCLKKKNKTKHTTQQQSTTK